MVTVIIHIVQPTQQLNDQVQEFIIQNATPTMDGIMSAADKAKLDGIPVGGGGGTLQQSYNAGGAGPQVINLDAIRLSIQLNAPVIPIGSLFTILDSGGGTIVDFNDNGTTTFRPQIAPFNGATVGIFNNANDMTTGGTFHFEWKNKGNKWIATLGQTGGSAISLFDPAVPAAAWGQWFANNASPFVQFLDFGANNAGTHIQLGAGKNITSATDKIISIAHNIQSGAGTEVGSGTLTTFTYGHFISNILPASAAPNANAGTGATFVLAANSTDEAGVVTLTTGNAAWAAGVQGTVTFGKTFPNGCSVEIFPADQVTANGTNQFTNNRGWFATGHTNGFDLGVSNAFGGVVTLMFNYRVTGF